MTLHRLRPIRLPRAPSWDLPLVLRSLTQPPYEPLDQSTLKFLSHKTAFLLAICSAERVGELHALSASGDCLRWKADGTGVSLWPNPAFLPKVVNPQTVNQVIEVNAFRPDPNLCPVQALSTYIARTQSLRSSHSQLFVCFCADKLGLPVSKQCLSCWVANTISEAYSMQGLPAPGNVVAHSTRSVATSWAALLGVPFSDIYAAASWSAPCTFARFYRVNVASPSPLGSTVLSAAGRGGVESSVPCDADGTSHSR